jgi:hypothetical protein
MIAVSFLGGLLTTIFSLAYNLEGRDGFTPPTLVRRMLSPVVQLLRVPHSDHPYYRQSWIRSPAHLPIKTETRWLRLVCIWLPVEVPPLAQLSLAFRLTAGDVHYACPLGIKTF